ncbi:MAG: FAD-dependent oxidoreductase [Chloroflexi bacterium]|nr:FAD-dependent oxidoreductase [Chloroflexota bacterium]
MRLINDTLLRDTYDVIVVGAGLGGMTAASLLAKRGLSVLMIEQQGKPGGSCTSFRRAGVTFDVGTAMLYGFGERGFKPFRFLFNELEEPVEVVAHATLARMTFEGQPITFWPDVERFLQELDRLFPDEKDGLRAFYRDLYVMYENIVLKNEVIVPPSEFSPRQGLRSLLSGPLQTLKMVQLLDTSVRSLLDRYFKGEAVINFFDKLCSAYCYCTAEETPAVLAATMFLDNHIGGVYYPAGGAQMLPNKLEKAFERLGGQALYHTLVDEILIRDGQAYSVRLRNGVEIGAARVIANATVWNLYGKLVRPEHIRPERLTWAQALVPTFPSMTLYLVVDRAALPADVLPWEVFIENRAVIDSSDLTLYINALVDETLCPPGKLVITAIAPNLESWPAPGSPEDHSAAYFAQKKAQAQRMLDQVEQHFPGFCSHIETLLVGTPTTIERYLLKNWGAVGGPKNALGQQMLKRLHARSEWKNLYVCGDSTVMATGAPATVVSGVGAANRVLRDLRKPEYDARKFPRPFVEFVETPYRRPTVSADEGITPKNAALAASQCQGCEDPACVADCPAQIDIPGVLRRMEAGNFTGAARELHLRSPFGGLCGAACPAGQLCERRCYRRSFAGRPVRIAELLRWVVGAAGSAGWPFQSMTGRGLTRMDTGSSIHPRSSVSIRGTSVAIWGGNLAGWTCACYLALAGYPVDVLDSHDRTPAALDMAQDELEVVLGLGVRFCGELLPAQVDAQQYAAVYLASDEWAGQVAGLAHAQRGRLFTAPVGADLLPPAGAVAEGRAAATAIYACL